MLERWPDRPDSARDPDFADIPPSGSLAMIGGGILVPLLFIGYGAACFLTGHGVMGGRVQIELTGRNAAALGIASASLGFFLHCHFFWGNVYHLSFAATIGKIVSLLAFIGSIGWLFVRLGIYGR